MKRPPKTDMEIRFRRLLEENFPYTMIRSRRGEIPSWKRAIVDYLYHELKLTNMEITRIVGLDHTTVKYYMENEICCKKYNEFKQERFAQFKEFLQ